MYEVKLSGPAAAQFDELNLTIQARVAKVFKRLERWPEVSGVQALTGQWAGLYRVRTGKYRVIFRVTADQVIVERIGDRKDVYDE